MFRNLISSSLLLAAIFAVSAAAPTSVHAQAATTPNEKCFVAGLGGSGIPQEVPRAVAESSQGFCQTLRADGSVETSTSFTVKEEITQTRDEDRQVTSTVFLGTLRMAVVVILPAPLSGAVVSLTL